MDFDVLNGEFASSPESTTRRRLANLSHHVPIIENADLSTLVQLRRRESEAFEVYRDSLSATLSQVQDSDADRIQQAFDDLIRPEINKIELAVRNSRKSIKSSLGEDLIFGAGYIGLGVFGGFLSLNLGELIGTVGGFHYSAKVMSKIRKLLAEPEEAKNSKFYFYWKANRVLKYDHVKTHRESRNNYYHI